MEKNDFWIPEQNGGCVRYSTVTYIGPIEKEYYYDGKLVIGEPFYRIMGGHNKLYNFVLESVCPRKKLFSKAWEKVHEGTI